MCLVSVSESLRRISLGASVAILDVSVMVSVDGTGVISLLSPWSDSFACGFDGCVSVGDGSFSGWGLGGAGGGEGSCSEALSAFAWGGEVDIGIELSRRRLEIIALS